jgi:hypothetical protein
VWDLDFRFAQIKTINMLGTFAIIFWFLILVVYFVFTASVFYHFKKYTTSRGQKRIFLSIFSIVSLILFVSNLIFFSRIPWNKISDILMFSAKGLGGF